MNTSNRENNFYSINPFQIRLKMKPKLQRINGEINKSQKIYYTKIADDSRIHIRNNDENFNTNPMCMQDSYNIYDKLMKKSSLKLKKSPKMLGVQSEYSFVMNMNPKNNSNSVEKSMQENLNQVYSAPLSISPIKKKPKIGKSNIIFKNNTNKHSVIKMNTNLKISLLGQYQNFKNKLQTSNSLNRIKGVQSYYQPLQNNKNNLRNKKIKNQNKSNTISEINYYIPSEKNKNIELINVNRKIPSLRNTKNLQQFQTSKTNYQKHEKLDLLKKFDSENNFRRKSLDNNKNYLPNKTLNSNKTMKHLLLKTQISNENYNFQKIPKPMLFRLNNKKFFEKNSSSCKSSKTKNKVKSLNKELSQTSIAKNNITKIDNKTNTINYKISKFSCVSPRINDINNKNKIKNSKENFANNVMSAPIQSLKKENNKNLVRVKKNLKSSLDEKSIFCRNKNSYIEKQQNEIFTKTCSTQNFNTNYLSKCVLNFNNDNIKNQCTESMSDEEEDEDEDENEIIYKDEWDTNSSFDKIKNDNIENKFPINSQKFINNDENAYFTQNSIQLDKNNEIIKKSVENSKSGRIYIPKELNELIERKEKLLYVNINNNNCLNIYSTKSITNSTKNKVENKQCYIIKYQNFYLKKFINNICYISKKYNNDKYIIKLPYNKNEKNSYFTKINISLSMTRTSGKFSNFTFNNNKNNKYESSSGNEPKNFVDYDTQNNKLLKSNLPTNLSMKMFKFNKHLNELSSFSNDTLKENIYENTDNLSISFGKNENKKTKKEKLNYKQYNNYLSNDMEGFSNSFAKIISPLIVEQKNESNLQDLKEDFLIKKVNTKERKTSYISPNNIFKNLVVNSDKITLGINKLADIFDKKTNLTNLSENDIINKIEKKESIDFNNEHNEKREKIMVRKRCWTNKGILNDNSSINNVTNINNNKEVKNIGGIIYNKKKVSK